MWKKRILLYIPLIITIAAILGAKYYNDHLAKPVNYYETEEGKAKLKEIEEYFKAQEDADKEEFRKALKEMKERIRQEELMKKEDRKSKKASAKRQKNNNGKTKEGEIKFQPKSAKPEEKKLPIEVQYKISEESLMHQLPWDLVIGDEKAPLTIVEYMSFSCKYCREMQLEVIPEIKKDYVDTGKAKLLFRPFSNKKTIFAGILLKCVDQDKLYDIIYDLFKNDTWLINTNTIEALRPIAEKYGINKEKFDLCIADKNVGNLIIQQQLATKKLLGLEATPVLYINGEKIYGAQSYKKVKKVIEKQLKSDKPFE